MAEQQPSVGRIVHYTSHGTPVREDGSQAFPPQCRAAIVTEVDDAEPYKVGLAVLNPGGMFFHSLASGGCMADFFEAQGGTWHWPERV
ncbi:hypothetical protein SZN_09191 [Streptomyces zinciresistens K42]|uniref:Uncharacterized protein n=1 Tax=Streptomyces zinciresistens K42 TaxID=700597 RepID=G2G8M0_9ACTN|nr:hypothetical protein [Streptomyces zinciresistens]EGX60085.1 hypothetical protein SZN_09191 [Streptomyces zinciresistens K42]